MIDGRPEAVRKREAELRASHRDLTAPEIPLGRDGESLRSNPKFAGITDQMLAERAGMPVSGTSGGPAFNLSTASVAELDALQNAVAAELAARNGAD